MLNVNVPFHFYAYVFSEFLKGHEAGHGEKERVLVFGLSSHASRALGFHVLTEAGATFWNVPIHGLAMTEGATREELSTLQPWDCFSENVTALEFKALRGLRLEAWLSGERRELGSYLFTVDWFDNGYSFEPEQAKCAHIIALDNGCLAALPNNRVIWFEASFTTSKPGGERPPYRVNTKVWRCETEKKETNAAGQVASPFRYISK